MSFLNQNALSFSNASLNRVTLISATGGNTITTDGDFKVHKFTSSGTFTVTGSGTVEYMVIAGGGGAPNDGSETGSGGAGGYRIATDYAVTSQAYAITVGAGGVTGYPATNGSNSSIVPTTGTTITSTGGGAGTYDEATANSGGSGAGGNGFSSPLSVGGSGNTPSTSPSQGNNGGTGAPVAANRAGAGGGGAGGVGGNATGSSGGIGGTGGIGALNDILVSGVYVEYAGGGGGSSQNSNSGSGSASGGGGTGGDLNTAPLNGTANTGGGAGGKGGAAGGANGGSGIVILRYQFQ